MKKLENIVESKHFLPDESLQPHERSFLIQPEKPSNKARVGTMFGENSLASPRSVKEDDLKNAAATIGLIFDEASNVDE